MYNPQELQRKAQLNIHGIDTNAQTSLNNNNPPKQENEQHWIIRGGATIGNLVNNIVMGAVKSIEGIVDAGAMLVGLFGANVDDFVSHDFTADVFGTDEEGEGLLEWSWGRNLENVSYLDNDHMINQIADGVGGMLPTIALAIASGGTSLAGTAVSAGAKAVSVGAKVANVASKVAFVAGAAGNASESALQEGATYGQALGYGALSGAIEAGTEMIGGRVFGSATKLDNTLLGKLAVKTGTDKFISKGVGKAVYSFASEGLEEVVADLLDPVNKRITGVDSEATVDWAQLPKTFFIGGAVGSILDGFQSGASALIHKDKGGKHFVKVAESLEDISNTNKALAYLQQTKSVSQEKLNNAIIRSSERMMNSLERISEEFQSMTDKQRKLAFETIDSSFVNSLFNNDGSLKDGVLDSYSEVLRNGAKYNVSTNLLYKNKQIEKDINEINEQYKTNYEISNTELNQNQRKEFATINRNVARISKKTGVDFEFVLLKNYVDKQGKSTNAFINKNRIYATENAIEKGTWAESLSHETGHFAENSKEYLDYAKYITSGKENKLLDDAIADVVSNYYEDYGVNAKDGRIIVEKVANGEKLAGNEKGFYGEVISHITEKLFTTESSIKRFTRENTTLAQKIFNKIRDFLNIFKGTNAKRETVVKLRKAEILFERALESINQEVAETRNRVRENVKQYKADKKEYFSLNEKDKETWLKEKGYTAEDFADDVLDDDNELDNSGEIRYSFKGKRTARYINKQLDTPTLSFIRNELLKMYGTIDSTIADGIAIEKDNTIFVVDSGIEDGRVEFGVREKIIISDENLRKAKLEKINDRAISKGYVNIEISRRIKHSSDNDSDSSIGRELSKELSNNTRKSENNEGRISGKDATDGSSGLKFSIKNEIKNVNSYFGDGVWAEGINVEEYNLIRPKNREAFANIEYYINELSFNATFSTMQQTYPLRLGLFNALQEQENNIYSKLTEINNAFSKIQENYFNNKYQHDKAKNIRKDFINYLGYNGFYFRDSRDNVVFDINKKKTNLLDFSKDRAEARLEKVIKLFGETDNPKKAGWLLSNGKFVDYNRDSENILNDSGIVDYGDHWNIEKVFNKRRGYDAIDAFMAEGNIRLMPEAGGIELRNKPTYQQIEPLEKYIDSVIEELGVTLDLRAPGTTENVLPNYVFYDNTFDAQTIIKDIKSFYNIGHVPKVIDGIKFSRKSKITAEMTDSERYELLKEKKIENIPFAKELTKEQLDNIQGITSFEDLNKYFGAGKRSIIKKIASEFGIFKEYSNKDIELEFEFSKSNYNESYQKQKHDFISYAKMFSVFDDVVEKAVGIEIQNRNLESYKFDPTLKNVYVLVSAFIDGQSIVPVELEIKEFNDKNNKLYVAIALDKIKKTEVLEDRDDPNKEVAHSSLSVNIGIRDLLKNVNPNDRDFYKYIPKQFFDEDSEIVKFTRKDKADINQYTEKQYNDFGWARVNGVLSTNENENFKTKYNEIKNGTNQNIHKTLSGEYIVETNNMKDDEFAVNNVLVYAKGPFGEPKISKVIKINLDNETSIELVRDTIYEYETDRRKRAYTASEIVEAYFGEELISEFRLGDFPSYQESKAERQRQISRDYGFKNNEYNQREQDGRRNLDEDSRTIRFSRKENATYTLSDGQVKKKVANFTKLKVYSKVEAESIINSILETNFNLEDYSVRISGKTKAEAIDVLWKMLNTADAGKRTGISLKIADYIIDNTIIESIYLEEENQIYTETISFLKPYLHNVDLKALKGEIKYRYDTDNSVYLLWGKRKGEDGQTADQIAMELAENGFFIDAENETDIFFEMDRAYREAVRALKKKSDKFLADTLGKEEKNKLRQDIAKDILRAFDSNGKKSKLAEIIEQQKERAKVWKDLYYEEKQRNSAINNLLYEVGKIRDIHFGDFQNSTQSHNLLFRGSIERLSAIKHRGDLNKSGTRSIVAGLNEWYSKDNPVVGDRFIEDISYILNKISSGTGKLTAEEIKGLATAVAYFRHFIETNNKIFRAGKYVDAKPIVEDYIKKIAETQNLKISWAGKVFDKLFNNSKLNYMQTFNDPMTIARYMDKYADGFFTQTLESFREGAVNSAILEMELNASVEEFYDKHKKFLKNLKAKTVKYNNVEIPADKALYLYMALNREQALMGLARSGFSYKDDKGKTVRVAGFETNEDLTLDDIKIIASEVQSELEKQFTEEEIEYIKIAEKLFNEDCKKLKSERDKTRLGYSNVVDDYYIPIRRAYIAQSVDVDSLQFELDRVSNLSFNKSAVKGAKNELFIESLDLVLSRHLRGIAQYYHLSTVIDNFNIIYNMDIGGNANRVKSIASESVNVWEKGKTYLQDLISDIQGVKRGEGSRVFGFIRGSYAKYQLGANPKVWFTQLSSFFASTSILDYGSVIKGLAIKTNDVDKYCSLAKLRNKDNTAALAQGVLDKVDKIDKVSNVLMKPIGMTDRLVVMKLFGACQVQVQKNTGLKIGTEENKVKAGELLQKVILETQQNTMATERSQAMRSYSELMKTLTMFTSDSMKVVGRVIDSYGELSILKARRKATTNINEKMLFDKKINTARKKAAKTTSALVASAMFMALIAQAFRTLYNKDDEEDNIVENMVVDAIGNLFGGLPVFKDIYNKIVEGYDFDGYQYSAINDLLDSVSDVINLTGNIFSGNADSRDMALNIKKMSYAIGQLFGIPVRNVYNIFYGLTKRVSPETAYKIDDVFYKQSYNSDLKKAIMNNDEAIIATIAGLIMDENVGDFENGSTRSEVNRLLSAGFDVLPQSVPSSVTINEVQHSLTGPQQEKFRKAYSGAITTVDKLVSSNGYKIATDEAKAKAIKYVYRYYYYEAQHQALNVDLDSKLYLFGQIVPIEKMALALAEVPLLVENSTNKKTAVQRYLQASKLTSAQKYMLMGYFGYKNTKGEGVVKSAINKTSLTKEQKKLLLEKCGY